MEHSKEAVEGILITCVVPFAVLEQFTRRGGVLLVVLGARTTTTQATYLHTGLVVPLNCLLPFGAPVSIPSIDPSTSEYTNISFNL